MSKTAFVVDKDLLIQCIKEAESQQTFPNLSMLWETVASIYNTKGVVRKIKPGVV